MLFGRCARFRADDVNIPARERRIRPEPRFRGQIEISANPIRPYQRAVGELGLANSNSAGVRPSLKNPLRLSSLNFATP